MKIPKGMTEMQVIDTIDRVIDRFYKKFIFSHFDKDDIRQEARMIALEGLERYNGLHPLEHFLSVHIRNRLCNFKRNNYIRIDKPCLKCPFNAYDKVNNKCMKYEDMDECEPYTKWNTKNESKKNIISPIGLSYTIDDNEENLHSNFDPVSAVSNSEIVSFIDNNISVENRASWLKLKGGVKITKAQREHILVELKEMLGEGNFHGSEDW